MILERLTIKRNVNWKDNSVSYVGEIAMTGETANIQLRVDEAMCQKIIEMCAENIVEVAHTTARLLKAEIVDGAKRQIVNPIPAERPL